MVLHALAGLLIAADAPLPGLRAIGGTSDADVSLHLQAAPRWLDLPTPFYTSPFANPEGAPMLTVSGGGEGFHFRYADGTSFWIARDARAVWAAWPSSSTLEDTATYLTGPVLGFLLRLRGALALHASSVQVEDRALLLVGARGSGKSTLAAALGMHGCPMLADDVVHLREAGESWLAEPQGTPIRLWPDGASLVFGPGVTLPRLTPNWDKRALHPGQHGVMAAAGPVPIGGIVVLAPPEERGGPGVLQPLGGAEAFVALSAHGSAAHLLDRSLRAAEFGALARLVRSVPLVRGIPAHGAPLDRFLASLADWASDSGCVRGPA